MPPLVELENVTKDYGPHHALGPLDLTIPEGSVGLLGPNGAGKSTLIRLLLGLIPPTSGTVKVLGEPVTNDIRRRVGYMPEGNAVFPGLSGIEATAYAGELVGMGREDALKRAHQLLDYVQLGEERYRLAEGYSTGMKQRLKLAQALVHDPELLILDEPTEGVDPPSRLHLLDLIADLRRDHGVKILLSTHILPDVERIATHAIVLDGGRLVTHGTLDELRAATTKAHYVRVSGDVALLTDRLTAAKVKWERHDPLLRVELDDPRAVLRHVREAGLVVRHLAPATLTLEEAFEAAVAPGVSASG